MSAKSSRSVPGFRVAVLIGCAAAAFAGTAQAKEPITLDTANESRVVSYADLDLTSEQGTKVMYARLKTAAKSACGGAPDSREVRRYLSYRDCVDEALGQAIIEVDNARLQALHARRTNRAPLG